MKLVFVVMFAAFALTGCETFPNNWNSMPISRQSVTSTDLPPLSSSSSPQAQPLGDQVAPPPRSY